MYCLYDCSQHEEVLQCVYSLYEFLVVHLQHIMLVPNVKLICTSCNIYTML